jgi:hypothetical protein
LLTLTTLGSAAQSSRYNPGDCKKVTDPEVLFDLVSNSKDASQEESLDVVAKLFFLCGRPAATTFVHAVVSLGPLMSSAGGSPQMHGEFATYGPWLCRVPMPMSHVEPRSNTRGCYKVSQCVSLDHLVSQIIVAQLKRSTQMNGSHVGRMCHQVHSMADIYFVEFILAPPRT